MSWVWAVGAVWLLLGGLVGVLIGRGIRLADRKQAESTATDAAEPNFVVDPLPPHAGTPIPPQPGRPAAENLQPPATFDRG
jgi:hypothetical protein